METNRVQCFRSNISLWFCLVAGTAFGSMFELDNKQTEQFKEKTPMTMFNCNGKWSMIAVCPTECWLNCLWCCNLYKFSNRFVFMKCLSCTLRCHGSEMWWNVVDPRLTCKNQWCCLQSYKMTNCFNIAFLFSRQQWLTDIVFNNGVFFAVEFRTKSVSAEREQISLLLVTK